MFTCLTYLLKNYFSLQGTMSSTGVWFIFFKIEKFNGIICIVTLNLLNCHSMMFLDTLRNSGNVYSFVFSRKLLFAISDLQKNRELYSDLSFYLKKSWYHFIWFSLVNNVQKTFRNLGRIFFVMKVMYLFVTHFCISLKPDEKITADI